MAGSRRRGERVKQNRERGQGERVAETERRRRSRRRQWCTTTTTRTGGQRLGPTVLVFIRWVLDHICSHISFGLRCYRFGVVRV
ncbi:hypothetical protein Hanom_Chr15g01383581 [Helianthus anomalus]